MFLQNLLHIFVTSNTFVPSKLLSLNCYKFFRKLLRTFKILPHPKSPSTLLRNLKTSLFSPAHLSFLYDICVFSEKTTNERNFLFFLFFISSYFHFFSHFKINNEQEKKNLYKKPIYFWRKERKLCKIYTYIIYFM